ncbi:MarR family transcriptional regulator [Actinocrinis puniceicyclus]|uniref:MarR family transcriptional regulator n=1 Tax=Actinocrinis puniceicyclus TaxID=977794 RepID=A0A8J8BD60_9ACTN|nr:MarR family transcriptional regulator [Actinocrinis puniceicyclus]MBS2964913.1 MarR family transcriptional regulator [Actinocrinis puniceicyclus]
MPVDTFEQPPRTPVAHGPAPAQRTVPSPTTEDVYALTNAMRGLILQAKNNHRALEKSSDHGRVSVLFILSKVGPMRASALAKDASLDLSTISRHLRTLEEEGYIAKTADPDDKRAFQVGLTERGHDFVRQFWRDRVNAVRDALSEWTADDVRALTRLLDRFVRDTEGCS